MTDAYTAALAALEQAALLARTAARLAGHSTIPMTMVDAAIREASYIAKDEARAADAQADARRIAVMNVFQEAEGRS